MAEVTGGKSFSVTSYGNMLQCIDGMLGLTKTGPCPTPVITERGVVVSFQEIPGTMSDIKLSGDQKILRPAQGMGQVYWPIPESFWPDPSLAICVSDHRSFEHSPFVLSSGPTFVFLSLNQ